MMVCPSAVLVSVLVSWYGRCFLCSKIPSLVSIYLSTICPSVSCGLRCVVLLCWLVFLVSGEVAVLLVMIRSQNCCITLRVVIRGLFVTEQQSESPSHPCFRANKFEHGGQKHCAPSCQRVRDDRSFLSSSLGMLDRLSASSVAVWFVCALLVAFGVCRWPFLCWPSLCLVLSQWRCDSLRTCSSDGVCCVAFEFVVHCLHLCSCYGMFLLQIRGESLRSLELADNKQLFSLRIMPKLLWSCLCACIAVVSSVGSTDASAGAANEFPYLPPLLTFNNGSQVTTQQEWEAGRRAEIKDLLGKYLLGTAPDSNPRLLKAEEINSTHTNVPGGGTSKFFSLQYERNISFEVEVLIPSSPISPTGAPEDLPVFFTQWNHREWALLGLNRGYLGVVYPGADTRDAAPLFQAAYPEYTMALIRARALVASSVLDFVLSPPEGPSTFGPHAINASRVCVTGHRFVPRLNCFCYQ